MENIKNHVLNLFYELNKLTSKEFNSDTFTSAKTAQQCGITVIDKLLVDTLFFFDDNHKFVNYLQQMKNEFLKLDFEEKCPNCNKQINN